MGSSSVAGQGQMKRTAYVESEFEGGYVMLDRSNFDDWLGAQIRPKPQRKPGARGPVKGTVAHYAQSDRKHYRAMKRLMKEGKSITAAAKELAPKLQGDNSTEPSKATRLARRFREECGEFLDQLEREKLAQTNSH
jgi:hypothetical protein